MLTRKQHELLCFIEDRLAEKGISPSFEEMKDALGLKSKSGIHRLISALEEREFIRRLPNRARALEILRSPERAIKKADASQSVTPSAVQAKIMAGSKKMASNVPTAHIANDIIAIPLHGRIAAGCPIEAFEADETLALPAALLGPGDHYALEVSGDSMIDAGIFDGDYALIQRTQVAREGDIIVALIDDNDATLKYYRRDAGGIRLDPANATHTSQHYRADQVKVQGRLAGLLRRYH
jgi:repressor LexA